MWEGFSQPNTANHVPILDDFDPTCLRHCNDDSYTDIIVIKGNCTSLAIVQYGGRVEMRK